MKITFNCGKLKILKLLVAVLMCTGTIAQKKQPNIIFIMTDDHASQAVGAYGMRFARLNPTPTIDKLAEEGILFENAFCTNSICTPARATIMTGQHGHVNGVFDLEGKLKPKNQYLAHEMNKLGYETAIVGKWHLKHAPEAFDYYNVLPLQGDYYNPTLYSKTGGEKKEIKFAQDLTRTVNATKYEGHSSDVITDISLEWLKSKRDKSKPFFLMHHFKAPHDKFKYAPRYEGYLEGTELPEPASLWYNANNGSDGTRGKNDSLIHIIGSSVGHRNVIRNKGKFLEFDQSIPDPQYKRMVYQDYIKRYLRCVKGVDDNIKRLLDYLEAEGLMENTVIVYTSDQGFMLGEHDYVDKRWMYEESLRIPFIVKFPKIIKPASKTDAVINNTDVAPTLIELAGGKTPTYMQGKSFKSVLSSSDVPVEARKETYYRYWMHMAHQHNNPAHFGIRTKDYKLIFFYGLDYVINRNTEEQLWADNPESVSNFKTPPAWEFYDLQNDPEEMDNRYGHEKYAAIIADLKTRLKMLRSEVLEDDSKHPHIEKVVNDNWDK
ncbi:sulfatase family protein [Seonamhaeicola maritimus]|uniref:sulfatase family protein n=1 Tax=Seonamhaeicola maritimus TaxID=2591822 RepID=UPI0024956001|nr:sulfatase [Seonamhaeicola maritimus]